MLYKRLNNLIWLLEISIFECSFVLIISHKE
nr:MAG TPA: hypothetical protein [Caudoviricetes sp.]